MAGGRVHRRQRSAGAVVHPGALLEKHPEPAGAIPCRNTPLNVYTHQPFPRYTWLTSIEPVAVHPQRRCHPYIKHDEYFLLGNASREHPGLLVFSTHHQRVVPCKVAAARRATHPQGGTDERVWDMSVCADRIVLLGGQRSLFTGILQGADEGVEVAGLAPIALEERAGEGAERIEQVCLAPHGGDLFATRNASHVRLWSLSGQSRGSVATTQTALATAAHMGSMQWSPHNANLLACTVGRAGVALYDTRAASKKSKVRQQTSAHPISDRLWESLGGRRRRQWWSRRDPMEPVYSVLDGRLRRAGRVDLRSALRVARTRRAPRVPARQHGTSPRATIRSKRTVLLVQLKLRAAHARVGEPVGFAVDAARPDRPSCVCLAPGMRWGHCEE